MKTLSLCSLLLLTLALAVAPASASVNMDFTGVTGGQSYQGVETYPYLFNVGSTSNVPLMCLSFHEEISGGETWLANEGTVTTSSSQSDQEAAWLFRQDLVGTPDPDINGAIWYLFEGAPPLTSGAQAFYDAAVAAYTAGFSNAELAGIVIYTAIPGTQTGDLGTPQNFMGVAPEPGTLVMFGSGIVGLAGLLRRKLIA